VFAPGGSDVDPEHAAKRVFEIPEGETRVGRLPANDLCLADSSISRNHCRFVRRGAEVRIFDTRSRNRTRVGKQAAHGKLLLDGDVIRLGRLKARFREGSPRGPATPAAPVSGDTSAERSVVVRAAPAPAGVDVGASETFRELTRVRRVYLLAGAALLVVFLLCGLGLGSLLEKGRDADTGSAPGTRLQLLERRLLLQGGLLADLRQRLGRSAAATSPAEPVGIDPALQLDLASVRFALLRSRLDDLAGEVRSAARPALARNPSREPTASVRLARFDESEEPTAGSRRSDLDPQRDEVGSPRLVPSPPPSAARDESAVAAADPLDERGVATSTVPAPPGPSYFGIAVSSRRVAFLLDVSASMGDRGRRGKQTKMQRVKEELSRILEELAEDSRINIIAFHGWPVPWKEELHALEGRGRIEALRFVRSLPDRPRPAKLGIGTNVHDPLELALTDRRVDVLYLLSDGRPNLGKYTRPAQILEAVAALNPGGRVTIHCLGFGDDVGLLEDLATQNGGVYRSADDDPRWR
jgi:Mg-chelatase subunit ChlD